MPITREYQRERHLSNGKGFLQSRDPKEVRGKEHTFMGAIVVDRDCKKGRKLFLNGWLYTNERGTIMYITIANGIVAEKKKAKAFLARLKERNKQKAAAKKAQAKAQRIAAKKAPKPPVVVKRGDIL